jgi:transketolase
MSSQKSIEQLSIDTIRTLLMDAVQAANSGHPGTPMGLAPVVYTLWQQFLRFDPEDPIWPNRDRFVLSVGHASMLLYAVLHLTGVKAVNPKYEALGEAAVTLDDIKRFRQLDSKCPGHPEYRWTSGVETTTGPLGQGVATSVGMAIAGRWMASYFNRPGFELFDYSVYALCGDGDMMEGVASEAASLAGHLKLANLCWIYDNNQITIEGATDLAFSEDVANRFRAYGWNVTQVRNANDSAALAYAYGRFAQTTTGPTLIIVDTQIGYGAPTKQGTSAAHGEPLGAEEIRLTKRAYGWPEDATFLVPDGVREHFRAGIGARAGKLRAAWFAQFEDYQRQYPDLADQLFRMQHRQLPDGWDRDLPTFGSDPNGLASRDSSGKVLNAIAQQVPWLIGGAADLAPSTKTRLTFEGAGDFTSAHSGRNLHFGVREHAMGAILNGLSLCKIRSYGAGFLIFSEYARPAIRLSALMELPTIHIFTHDSIGVGEDGPTHQPIEQLAALRAIPGLITLRPADANEVVEAWKVIMQLRHEQVALILTRQLLTALNMRRRPALLKAPMCWPMPPMTNPRWCCWQAAARSRCASRRTSNSPQTALRRGWSAYPRGSCSSSRAKNIATASFHQTLRRGSQSSRRRPLAGRALPASMACGWVCAPSAHRRRSRSCRRSSASLRITLLPQLESWCSRIQAAHRNSA